MSNETYLVTAYFDDYEKLWDFYAELETLEAAMILLNNKKKEEHLKGISLYKVLEIIE